MIEPAVQTVPIAADGPRILEGRPVQYEALMAPEPAPPAPPLALIDARESEAWFTHLHTRTREIGGLGVFTLPDVVVSGDGYLFVGDKLLDDGSIPSAVALRFVTDEARNQPRGLVDVIHRAERVDIAEPVVIVFGPGHRVWGHWLADFFPRVALFQSLVGRDLGGHKLLLPDDTPGWALRILEFVFGIGARRILFFEHQRQTVLCRRATIPSYCHTEYFLHSFNAAIWAPLLPNADRGLPKKICISRRRIKGPTHSVQRSFLQQAEFEDMAIARGYTPIAPETLDFRTQLDLFAGGRMIVGEHGSGLHDTLFSPRGAVVGSVDFSGELQSRIAALRGQPMVFLICRDTPEAQPGMRRFAADPARFADFFDAMEDFAGAERDMENRAARPTEPGGPRPFRHHIAIGALPEASTLLAAAGLSGQEFPFDGLAIPAAHIANALDDDFAAFLAAGTETPAARRALERAILRLRGCLVRASETLLFHLAADETALDAAKPGLARIASALPGVSIFALALARGDTAAAGQARVLGREPPLITARIAVRAAENQPLGEADIGAIVALLGNLRVS